MERRSEGVNQNEAGIGVNDPFLAASVVDCFDPYSLYSSLFPSLKSVSMPPALQNSILRFACLQSKVMSNGSWRDGKAEEGARTALGACAKATERWEPCGWAFPGWMLGVAKQISPVPPSRARSFLVALPQGLSNVPQRALQPPLPSFIPHYP